MPRHRPCFLTYRRAPRKQNNSKRKCDIGDSRPATSNAATNTYSIIPEPLCSRHPPLQTPCRPKGPMYARAMAIATRRSKHATDQMRKLLRPQRRRDNSRKFGRRRSATLVGVVMSDLSQIVAVVLVAKLWLTSVTRLRVAHDRIQDCSIGFVGSRTITGSGWACHVQSLASWLLAQGTGWRFTEEK